MGGNFSHMIRALFSRDSMIAKLFRFGLAGGLSTLFYGVCAWCFVYLISLPPVVASIIGYLLAIPVSFILQRKFAFRSLGNARAELPRFLLVQATNLVASTATMHAVVNLFHANPTIGVLITMIVIPLLSFITMHFWVFPIAAGKGDR
jgi:putative flippase GtrA